jgi:hypothetical protein
MRQPTRTAGRAIMEFMPTGYVHLGHLDEIVKEASGLLGPEVLHVSLQLRPDSTDVPSIFFSILLADDAFHEDTMVKVTRGIAEVLLEAVRPLENWGLRP